MKRNNENKILVSIVMSTYNEKEEDLKLAIESILNQSYKNIEFIIILDNPKNKEIKETINEYLASDARIRVIYNEKNLGLVKSLNKGIAIANGEYIARMDADDISNVERIKMQVEFLSLHSDIDLVGTNIQFIDENNNNINMECRCPTDSIIIKNLLKSKNCMNHPTWMFKKDIIDKIGAYKSIKYAEDYELICRLVANNYKVANIDSKLLKYRIRDNGISVSNEYKQIITSKYIKYCYNEKLKNNNDIFNDKELEKLLRHNEKVFLLFSAIRQKSCNNKFKVLFYKVLSKSVCLFDKYLREDIFDEIRFKKIYKKS